MTLPLSTPAPADAPAVGAGQPGPAGRGEAATAAGAPAGPGLCGCGSGAPYDGGKEGVCECCSTCTPPTVQPRPHSLRFTVLGVPISQGSKDAYVNPHTGRAVVVETAGGRHKAWRVAVKEAALDALDRAHPDRRGVLFTGPVMVTAVFTFARPKGHYRTGRNAHLLRDAAPKWPTSKPDVGKAMRAVEDSLTDAGVYRDDAQIVVSVSVKTYPDVHPRALQTPGAYIRITPLPPETTESG